MHGTKEVGNTLHPAFPTIQTLRRKHTDTQMMMVGASGVQLKATDTMSIAPLAAGQISANFASGT
jgi:hypothetical protein